MAASFLTSLHTIEPQIHIPSFFKPKAASKPRDSSTEQRIIRLDQFDRYLRLLRHNNDQWLRKRGKGKYTAFTPSERQQMKLFFAELDTDKSGGVTIDELMEPLIALGLAKTKADVTSLFRLSPNDPNPVIDFEEFQSVLEAEHLSHSRIDTLLRAFLKPSPLPFKLRISSLRRKVMMQAYTSSSPAKKESGRAVLKLLSEETATPRTTMEKSEMLVRKKLSRLGSPHRSQTPRASPGLYRRTNTAMGVRARTGDRGGRGRETPMELNVSGFL